ncbi:ankyrin repeat ph and sec7 domain containing protein secg-related [Anaeramoeba ignava]|uniref:Ankyrin repeat ph and sec7 domain containing protein secg-related n=1 Tax=Anaeramoeba ignava TaxID=1746090 RepID=A0A9Q0R594_ANAIG|nr:ankyrin repeat ph and sec7 domain containing protein secg-related [Anaeramoeba ignava]
MDQTNSKKLFIFCEQNSLENIQKLISQRIDINITNFEGETPLHIICQNINENSLQIIKLLIENGAGINVKNKHQETPLHLICQISNQSQYSVEIIQYLVSEKGADINVKTGYTQENPLHLICRNENPNENSVEIIKYLVSKRADINSKTGNKQQTPLHLVCQNQNRNEYSIEIIKYLVSNGTGVNIKDKNQETALHLICKNEYQNRNQNSFEIIKYLVSNGANINLKSKLYNETPLHLICKNHNQNQNENSFEIVKFLVLNGANLNTRTSYYQTPLSLAIQNQNQKVIRILLLNGANLFHSNINLFPKEFIDLLIQIYSINQDLINLLKSNDNFSDLEIQSIDSFKFQVHRLILLTRFDNNQTNLQKFINICKRKSKEDVEIALNFIYTGFPDFEIFNQQIEFLKKITDSFYSKTKKEQQLISTKKEDLKKKERSSENKLKEFFKEIGFDSNWIESKKGRKGILEDLHKLYEENQNKDFTIIISEEKEIKVHKLILILRSEVYKGMFLSVNDSSNQVHDYSKKSNETIQQLIYFLYHDEEKEINSKINSKMIEEFEDLKDYYQLNENSIIDLFLKDLI